MSILRLFIADDHPMLVEGIERIAAKNASLEVVGTAANAEDLARLVAEARADVLSLDVQMPGMRGPSTIASIVATGVPILLFTLHPIDAALAALVRAGAAGYLSKSHRSSAYVEAVRSVAQGETVVPAELADLLRATEPPGAPSDVLTPRELEVFRRLAAGSTIKEAAFALGMSASTAYTHTDRIRRKLGVSTGAEMARYATSWNLDPES